MRANGKLLGQAYDLYIFDLDRTLVMTPFDYIYQCIVATVQELGGIIPNRQLAETFWLGRMHRDHCIFTQFNLQPEVFWPAFRKYDTPENRAANTHVIPGAVAALERLKDKDKKTAIITAATPIIARAEIALIGFEFDGVLALSENNEHRFKSKPDPESMRHMMKQFGVTANRTLFTGDSTEDDRFAQAANVDFAHFDDQDGRRVLDYQPVASFSDWSRFLSLRLVN